MKIKWFSKMIIPKNPAVAKTLPKGWTWIHYDDHSGGLESPDGVIYVMYDLTTGEIWLNGKWTFWKGYPDPMNVNDAVTEGENFVKRLLDEYADSFVRCQIKH